MSLQQVIADYTSLRNKIVEQVREQLQKEFMKLFEEHPEIDQFGWVQYAPHYNDGDPCEFRVQGLSIHRFSEIEDENWINEYYEVREDRDEDLNNFMDLWDTIPYDIMLELFGHDAKIIVTRQGIEVEEYEHD